jgi:hypothetical protein
MFAEWAKVAKKWSSLEPYQLYRKLRHSKPQRAATPQDLQELNKRYEALGDRDPRLCPDCGCAASRVLRTQKTRQWVFSWRQCRHCTREFRTSQPTTVRDVEAEQADRRETQAMEDELNSLYAFVEAQVPQWLSLVPLLDEKRDARTDEQKVRASLELYGNLLQKDLDSCQAGPVRRKPKSSSAPSKPPVDEAKQRQTLDEFLAANPHITDAHAVREGTGLTVWKIHRSSPWQAHLERVLEAYLDSYSEATLRSVERDLGIDTTKASGMQAWRRFKGQAEAAALPESQLSDAMLACRPDERQSAPEDVAERRETIFKILLENSSPDVRSRLHKLSESQRTSLVEHLVSDPTLTERQGEVAVEAMLSVAEAYLDELSPPRR